ncbi:hypothetical protein AB0467_02990 [Streptomyces sp. NPDC052095]
MGVPPKKVRTYVRSFAEAIALVRYSAAFRHLDDCPAPGSYPRVRPTP